MGVPSGTRPFADVPALERGAGGQDDVGELGLALHPDRLVDDELDAPVPIRVDPAARFGDGAQGRSAVAIDHVDRRIARHGIGKGGELRLLRHAVPQVAGGAPGDDGVGQLLARHHLLDRVHRQHMRHALIIVERIACPGEVAGDPAVRIAGEVEMQVVRRADLETAEIDAGLAPALHRHHHDHRARPLLSGRAAACAAEPGAGHADWPDRPSCRPTCGRARARPWPERRSPPPAIRESWGRRRFRPADRPSIRRSRWCGRRRSPGRKGLP